jgi:uncharacterized protein
MHQRLSPRRYGFNSRLFQFLLDIDEIDDLCRRLPLVSHNRRNVYSFRDSDHLYFGHTSLRDNVHAYLKAEGIGEVPARILLLTNLRVLGYVFNPVSFYFCERADGSPLCLLAEVHNTYGELKPFLIRADKWDGSWLRDRQEKEFYISPFSALDTQLTFRLAFPGERLALFISEERDGIPFFHSSLTGHRRALTSGSLLRYSLRFPFVTLRIIALIHWHALGLWLKKVPHFRKRERLDQQRGILPKINQIKTPS